MLGVVWEGSTDTLLFSLQDAVLEALSIKIVTKRVVLRVVAGIFDPLGILCALVIILKLHFQKVCAMKVDWDVPLPQDFIASWTASLRFLSSFEPIRIPRHYIHGYNISSALKIEIRGFSDASLKAIAVSKIRQCAPL